MKLRHLIPVLIAVAASVTGATAQAAPMTPAAVKAAATACTAPAFATPEAASAAFANVPGISGGQEKWLAGDGGWTVVHPTTCNRLHIFGDSAVLNSAGQRVMPNGNAVLQTHAGLQLITRARDMIPDSPDGSIDWPGPPILSGNRLFTFTSHINTVGMPGGEWRDLGKDLAEFAWTGGTTLTYVGKWVTPSTGRPWKTADGKYNIMWGAAAQQHSGYTYVFGTYRQDGWFGHRVYVARVPTVQLQNVSAWRFWNGSTWGVTESLNAPTINEHGGPESSFSIGVYGSTFRIVSKRDGTFGDTVQRWSSTSTAGPWTLTELFKAPWVETDQTYLVTAHYDMRYSNGQVPVTISHGRGSSGSLGDMYDRPERYRNTWHGVAP